jgi:EmrB/QacA subfamily drug resistance transporter
MDAKTGQDEANKKSTVSAEELAARYGTMYKWYVLVTILVGLISMVASATIVNVAMPDIMGEFGLGQDQAQWMSTAFLAAMTAAMLAATSAVQTFGVRRTYISALIAFAGSSIIGALSPNEDVLIAARVIQGAAAGIAQPLGMVSIFQAFPPDRRGMAMGMYGVGVILAPALGPTLGGILIDNYSWHYVFLLGPPLCFAGIPLASIFLPTRVHANRTPFDWIGFGLLCICLVAFLTGLSNGQRIGWDSSFVLGSFFLAAISMCGFIIQERRVQAPILALNLYLNPRFVAASAVAFILGMGLYGSTYLVPLFVQTIQGYTPTESGLLLMPAGLILGIVFPITGRLSDRVAAHIMIAIGLSVFGWASFLMSRADTSTPFWSFAGWVALGRLGLGFILPSLNGGALRVLDRHLVSDGAGAINFMRQLGGAIGVDALSVYLERETTTYAAELNAMQTGNHAAARTLDLLSALLRQDGISGMLGIAEAHRFMSRMIEAQASILGFRESFLLVAAIFLLALVPAWYMRVRPHSEKSRPTK